ncbi:glycosyltransferase [Pseudoalteromonas sp. T1lg10]|uniref:glycosyltransferase n=1 Tax=Pseudoalteromonas sp. T1lg10 TaxID=2077093 RepID=UPI001319F297|nr:glycosyltransferase [Pseudoalteromonas sp. T1lg10]
MELLDYLNKFNKPLIIGPLPPPIGGVSVFIERLAKYTKSEVFNTVSGSFFQYFRLIIRLFKCKNDVVHLNVITLKYLFLVFLFYDGDVILTDHNNRLFSRNKLACWIIKGLLRKVSAIFVVSQTIKDSYQINGVQCKSGVFVSNSFIPPCLEREHEILHSYPRDLLQFITNENVILVSGYKLKFYDGRDLYGFDVAVKTQSRLLRSGINARLLIVIPDLDSDSNQYIKQLLEINNIPSDLVYIFSGQIEMWPLFRKISLFIRPTITDGFGISVAESVFLGCPAIASNVCIRYNGTILYDVDDQCDLYNKAKRILEKYES